MVHLGPDQGTGSRWRNWHMIKVEYWVIENNIEGGGILEFSIFDAVGLFCWAQRRVDLARSDLSLQPAIKTQLCNVLRHNLARGVET